MWFYYWRIFTRYCRKMDHSMKKFLETQKSVEVMVLKAKEVRDSCLTEAEKGNGLRCQLDGVRAAIKRFIEVQEEALKKYEGLVLVLDSRKNLTEALAKLREQWKEVEKAHCTSFEELEGDLEVSYADQQKEYEGLVEDIVNEAKMVEVAHKIDVDVKCQKIQELKEELKNKEALGLKELKEIRKKNHRDLECLRNQVTQLQQNQSSRAVSNMDIITGRLQAIRHEYDAKVLGMENEMLELTTQNAALKEELQSLRETLEHQKHLNVARDVSGSSKTVE
ncbi:structural maintenance of chromosomes protein 2-like isoform X3 [Macrobrachium rosenbergii]|uniref:structural maintenance of chromosomes protein 2-like isoform X3 n=1 Tax=Macrobrachium rosenbergii TaxID=79674 RepID=UPI0034D4F263